MEGRMRGKGNKRKRLWEGAVMAVEERVVAVAMASGGGGNG